MRPEGEDFENLDRADRWLAKYTYENLDRWPSQDILKILVDRYPIEKSMPVYRGMNFSTKEQYEEFLKSIEDGFYTSGGVSSWSPSPDVEQFAVTRPSYFLDRETMRGYDEARKQREYIQGYRGVIVKTIAEPGKAINTNASKLGHESEITLLPGEYPIEIVRELKLYKQSLEDGDTDIETVIKNAPDERQSHSSDYDAGFYEYVLHHHVGKLSDEAKQKVFKRMYRKVPISFEVREDIFKKDPPRLLIFYDGRIYEAAMKGYFTEQDTVRLKREAKIYAKRAAKIIVEHPDCIIDSMLGPLVEFSGDDSIKRALTNHIRRQYQQLEQEGRAINKKGKSERSAFGSFSGDIYNHTKKLELVMNQLKSLH
jgi:hypothetical protein